MATPGSGASLGEIIRRQRELSSLSMRRFAELAGISNPYLSQIERGLREPSEKVVEAIARSLETSADALYAQAGIELDGADAARGGGGAPAGRRAPAPSRRARGRRRRRRPGRPRRRARVAAARVWVTELAQKVVLVTGAAGGIGRAIASRLVNEGARVLAVDREPIAGGPGSPFTADLGTQEGNRAAVEAVLERFGRLDAIVPNAGFQHVAPVAEFPEERWDALLNLLLTSPFLLAKYGWEALGASGDGRFVVIASAHALVASPYKAGYVAAKHGVLGLVKTLALEGAEHGVTATAVCPGFVRTPLVESQIAAQAQAHGLPEERVLSDVILAPHAVKRLIEPDEVAEVVAFLLGPGGRSFTGVPVTMDLGWSAR